MRLPRVVSGKGPRAAAATAWVRTVLAVALGGVLLHVAARFTSKALDYLRSPYSRDYGEGCVLAMVQLLDDLGTYFTSLRDYPFVHGNYPPVFIGLVWPFYRLLGPSLFVPRLLSLLATLGLLAVLHALLRRLSASPGVAAALTGLAAAPWFVQTWAPLGRVDMLALLFSLAGVLAFVRGARPSLVFALFWLGFFTKQNALLAPAAVLLHVAANGRWREAARAAAGFTLPLVILFAALSSATGGEAFRHLVTYTAAAEYEPARMGGSYLEFLRVAWPLLGLIAWNVARRPRSFATGPPRLVLLHWLLSLVGLATIAKAGAAQNYYIEPWLTTVVLAGVSLSSAGAAASPSREAGPARPGVDPAPPAAGGRTAGPAPRLSHAAVLLLAAAVGHYTSNRAHRIPSAIRHPERARDLARLWDVVREARGPVLSENLSVLVLNRKQVLLEPFGVLLLTRTGHIEPARLVRDCEARRFELVVVEHRLEEIPGLGECLARRYVPTEDLGAYRLLRPGGS